MNLLKKIINLFQAYKSGPLSGLFWKTITAKKLDISKSLNPADMSPCALIILQHNPHQIGGVEQESLKMAEWFFGHHPDLHVLMYYFEPLRRTTSLLTAQGSKVINLGYFENSTEKNLEWILNNYSIKIAVIEHLANHSLNYPAKLNERQIPTALFIHDFHYLYDKYHPKNFELSPTDEMKSWWQNIMQYNNLQVVFNSEFSRQKYSELLNQNFNPKSIISYPL